MDSSSAGQDFALQAMHKSVLWLKNELRKLVKTRKLVMNRCHGMLATAKDCTLLLKLR